MAEVSQQRIGELVRGVFAALLDSPEGLPAGFDGVDRGDYLAQMPPYDFQHLVAALLRAIGYHILWVAPPGRDGGIDMIAHTDPLGMTSPRIKVQVKRQADTRIPVDGLRSFLAVLGDNDVGIYVSAGGFTTDAQREARNQENADSP